MTDVADRERDQALLDEILDERPWRGPSYTIACGLYFGFFTLLAFIILHHMGGIWGVADAAPLWALLIGGAMDVACFLPRRRALDIELWRANLLTSPVVLESERSIKIKRYVMLAYCALFALAIAVAVVGFNQAAVQMITEYDGEHAVFLLGGLMLFGASLRPPMLPSIRQGAFDVADERGWGLPLLASKHTRFIWLLGRATTFVLATYLIYGIPIGGEVPLWVNFVCLTFFLGAPPLVVDLPFNYRLYNIKRRWHGDSWG